jgi:hypothetical protein
LTAFAPDLPIFRPKITKLDEANPVMATNTEKITPDVLAFAGEMGERILRTTVSLVLNNRFPMLLWWTLDYICGIIDRRDIQKRKLSIWEIYRTLAAFSMASQWPRWGY